MTNTKETAAHCGLAASTVLLCTGAAAGVSGFGGLLVTVFGAWLLLILIPVARLFRPLPAAIRQGALLLTAAFLATLSRVLLLAYWPAVADRLPPLWLFYAMVFSCAPAAEEWSETPPSGGRVYLAALAPVVIGAVRELLAYGTVFAVRLLPAGLSADFAAGGSGVVVAGLLLALFFLRGKPVAPPRPAGGILPAALAALTALAAGVLLSLLRMIWPVFPEEWLPSAAAFVTAVAALSWLYKPEAADGVWMAAAAFTAWLSCRSAGIWQALLWQLAGAAILFAVGCLFAAVWYRVDNSDLPRPFRSAPALLTTAGVLWLALAVL